MTMMMTTDDDDDDDNNNDDDNNDDDDDNEKELSEIDAFRAEAVLSPALLFSNNAIFYILEWLLSIAQLDEDSPGLQVFREQSIQCKGNAFPKLYLFCLLHEVEIVTSGLDKAIISALLYEGLGRKYAPH
ncbi:hypothetical protein WUBG_02744 [Wuchereria bancrofti]|uniref:Uncharacterized protein n=1 Tax=Wuchereria bancrofti TaxID=6293 RepID=J9F9U1_WUCBA|nr:hypothetical protein WUBG_02744 [Wuchereria bancrofti]